MVASHEEAKPVLPPSADVARAQLPPLPEA